MILPLKILLIILTLLIVGSGVWLFASWYVMRGVEEPKYTVVRKNNGYEIRDYPAYVIAETQATGNYETAMNDGFRTVADYIFGNNTSTSSIAMTAPVRDVAVGNKGDNHLVSFTMPSKYTLATLPKPNNAKVKLREIPARRLVVYTFSGYATVGRIELEKRRFLKLLTRDQVTLLSDPVVARFNPPFSVPFMMKNEIQVEI